MSIPAIIGHRGASALAPENTLAAFERALDDGADGIECDVHLTADEHVAIMHDETIDRTADPASPLRSGALARLTRADLDQVLLTGGHPVPSLTDLLTLLNARPGTVQAYVEVKAPAAAQATARALDARPGATVISFSAEALAAVRETAPALPIAYIVEDPDDDAFAQCERLGAPWLSVNVEAITPGVVRRAHSAGMRVNVWTVNTAEQLERAMRAGVDSISSDDPAWARAVLSREV